uniref:Uncharacterized protein n=1 Tax=Paramoeba aestuarina TaxID=180227 RepID=A0A7S4NQX4_9EUKA|eukprot:CAMPEP_0201520748 /NCGR_PEP_ID=MMETSP0161_2-20130828/12460_1 /ASSEMBLY_ACC=CAM_ASM_000251 /TAXON_ID=180227 /ORGANISM="Neoparamoeba aestuarina, Strain SoJaBio B1-5/56/2" /LENGTH=317 /DNA_ID=CAMNT_0047919227 /DNA_START=41 /DNA_END=994 /DNA_ORIENTATION=+
MTDQVIELDVHSKDPNTIHSDVKDRLEKEKNEYVPLTQEQMREKYENDLRTHAENRKRILEEKSKAARGHVVHAQDVAETHRKETRAEANELRAILQQKQEWARNLRESVLKMKADKASMEVVKSFLAAEVQKEEDHLTAEKLAEQIEKSQELAAKNRAALEQYKKVSAGAEVEHAQEVASYKALSDEIAHAAMESSLDAHQEAAENLRHMLLLHKVTKAQAEVEHAHEVHDKHDQEGKKELEESAANARKRHLQRIESSGEICGHEDVVRSLEVEQELREGQRVWVTYNDLALHLELLELFIAEQERVFNEFFQLE